MTNWIGEIQVDPADVDFQQKWKPSAFYLVMQNVASRHATQLGYSLEQVFDRNLMWVMARSKIRFYEFPRLGQKVTVETWPKGERQKIFFMRDFIFRNASGSKLAAITSAYVVINTLTRRVLPPQTLVKDMPLNNSQHALDEDLEKISILEDVRQCYDLQVGYSAVDLMQHVNNARYIEWIADCFALDQYQSSQMEWLQTNFIHEVKAGQQVSMRRAQDRQDSRLWIIQGVNLSEGITAFEAVVRWV